MSNYLLLMCLLPAQTDYAYVPITAYTRTIPRSYYYFTYPQPYIWTYSRTYKNKPRYVAPDHREKRLAWEKTKLTQQGRHDQLIAAVRQTYMRGGKYSELLELALDNADDYEKMQESLEEYKFRKHNDNPLWGRNVK